MVEVRQVVCDYGVYQDGNLICICNSERNAYLIKDILDKDNDPRKQYKGDYTYLENDFIEFNKNYNKKVEELMC